MGVSENDARAPNMLIPLGKWGFKALELGLLSVYVQIKKTYVPLPSS